MKKFLSLVVALVASTSLFAQSEAGSFSLLPKVGYSMGDMSEVDMGSRDGFVAGLEGIYQASDAFAVSAGLLYSQQGAFSKTEMLGAKVKHSLEFDYLNIPVLAQYYLFDGFAVKLGVQPGFLLSAKSVDKSSGSVSGTETEDIKDKHNSFDFSIPVGASYEYSNFVFDVRYNIGVTGVIKDEYLANDKKNPKHGVLQVTIGYKFTL